jgi:MoxR-like ATPase
LPILKKIMDQKSTITKEQLDESTKIIQQIQSEYEKAIIGQKDLMVRLLLALFSGGHILLEGVPGLAKTRSVNVISKVINAEFKRIQFTPDLLPSDIIGNLVFNPKEASYFTQKGPIFANIILADEINRAPAKVQSALLEAMQERQVTIGTETYPLPKPFLVLATQNPIEQEGTYPLPEAQIDRFLMKTVIDYPNIEEEVRMMELIETEKELKPSSKVELADIIKVQSVVDRVYMDEKLKHYIAQIIAATRNPAEYNMPGLKSVISFGSSPRGSLAFMKISKIYALLEGRTYVIPEDIKAVKDDILRHRIVLTYEAEADGVTKEHVIEEIVSNIKVP